MLILDKGIMTPIVFILFYVPEYSFINFWYFKINVQSSYFDMMIWNDVMYIV